MMAATWRKTMEEKDSERSVEPMRETIEEPTVGRKVWYWGDASLEREIIDMKQPFDATVCFVHPRNLIGEPVVNLRVTTHHGSSSLRPSVPLCNPGPVDQHGGPICYATWMPYQRKQQLKGAS
jgi:hypothetical protein